MNRIMDSRNLNESKNSSNYSQDDSVYYRFFLLFQHFFFKIFGLAPWAIDFSEIFNRNRKVGNQNFQWKFSYIGSFYNILLFLVLSSVSLYNLLGKLWNIQNSLLVSTMVEFLYFTLLCVSFISLIYTFRQKRLISVNNRFKNIDGVLNKCACYEKIKDNTNHVIFVINFLLTIGGTIIMDLYYFPLISVFFENLPTVISGILIIQYAMLLYRVNKRFKSINSTISKSFTIKCNEDQTQISSVTQQLLLRESVFNDIDNLKLAFMELREMCHDIANFYGIPILIVILSFGIRAISTLYFVVMSVVRVPLIHHIWHLDATRILWISFLFTTFTSSVTKIIKQNIILGKTINYLTDQNSMDEKIKTKLSKFSSDLWHLKIELTACEIIPLDRTLLATIIGTLATYLIIGVQFGLNAKSD
ncbi:putative gustatory receptor 28b [Microplitis mediator]|uniref:putative gustatory receptor 28b n=1 Tax=Microplitis mediator TaxID=375433 RepID=UPI0025554118|nr:putative gustatory receptor 28b [Microplitis mediator]